MIDSKAPKNGKSHALTATFVALAVSVPATIQAISDPLVRAIITVSALVAVFTLGVFHDRPKGRD